MLFGKLMPREGNFFELFNEHGRYISEGSKAFMKDLCAREGIPTAAYRRFRDAAAAKAYIAAAASRKRR